MKKWWDDHHRKIENNLKEKEKAEELLASERLLAQQLMEENEKVRSMVANNVTLSQTCDDLQERNTSLTKELLAAKDMPPMLKKERDRPSMLKILGEAVLFMFNVVMHRPQVIKQLHALVEVVFDKELFGSFAKQKVLKEISLKCAQRNVFLPWKVIRRIDLAINGGINFNGNEALRKVEDLSAYQRGFLPSQQSVQLCSARLHDLGQELIPFERVNSQLGGSTSSTLRKCFVLY
jgi:hypothetical protein